MNRYLNSFLLLNIYFSLNACSPKGEEINGKPLTEDEKSWLPYSHSDTLKFRDETNANVYMVVDKSEITKSNVCMQNCSGHPTKPSISVTYETKGVYCNSVIFLNNSKNPLNFTFTITHTENAYDSARFYMLFTDYETSQGGGYSQNSAGYINPSTPDQISSFKKLGAMTFNGVMYPDIFATKLLPNTASLESIDSVYLNKRNGILRFTTTQNKAFTRYQ